MQLKPILGAALLAGMAAMTTAPAVADDRSCGLVTGSYKVWEDDEVIGKMLIGETPSNLILDGTIEGEKIGFRMISCQDKIATFKLDHSSEGPATVTLQSFDAGATVVLGYVDPDGQEGQLVLTK